MIDPLEATPRPAANPRIKLIFVGCYAATIGMVFFSAIAGIVAEGVDRGSGELVQSCFMLPAVVTILGWFGSALYWVYDAWSSIPEEHRNAPIAGAVSPGGAVALFFIPCFNLVWMFAINYAIADSINRTLAAQGSAEQCSTGLAMSACALHAVPYCNILFGPILWFFWMRDADRARGLLGRVDAFAVADAFS